MKDISALLTEMVTKYNYSPMRAFLVLQGGEHEFVRKSIQSDVSDTTKSLQSTSSNVSTK